MNAPPGKNNKRSYSGKYMEVGKHAEKLVKEWLEKSGYVVLDCRCDPEYQEKEIDYKVVVGDTFVTTEVKSDYHLGVSGNVLFEVLRINHTAPPEHAMKLGWSARTEADRIVFYAPQPNKIYKIKTADYIKAMQDYTYDARGDTNFYYVETDNIKSTVNILIPVKYFEGMFTIEDVI